MIALIFRTMEAFKTFDIAFTMTSQPAAELIAVRLYKQAFQQWDTGKSCALAYIILIMVVAITNIYVKYLNRAKER
jgi:multiple sugar transport system permease protein